MLCASVVLFRVVEYATEVTTAFAVVVSNLLTVETAIVFAWNPKSIFRYLVRGGMFGYCTG